MSDPRNVAHDKKVAQEKKHEHESAEPKARKSKDADEAANDQASKAATPAAAQEQSAAELEKSLAVLSKLKEMEFHSRANIETLAELTLTIDDELKQREFSDPIGALYSAQDSFQSKITPLIESYAAKCDTLKPA